MISFIKRLGLIVFIASFIFACTTSVKSTANIDPDVQTKIFKKKIKSNPVNFNSKVQEDSRFNKSDATKKSYMLPPLPPENPNKSKTN